MTENLLLSNNSFSGQVRNSFGNWETLSFMDLARNMFTGNLPDSLFEVQTLRILYLRFNKFEGSIPSTYANAPQLRDLYISHNMLTGEIPAIQGNQFSELNEFLLEENELQGTMPPSICNLATNAMLEDLWADCISEVDCECCTRCF